MEIKIQKADDYQGEECRDGKVADGPLLAILEKAIPQPAVIFLFD
jgi:hypothetical protein